MVAVNVNGVNERESAITARDETYPTILNTALILDISFLPLIYPKAGMPFPDQARAEEMEHSPRCKGDLALPKNERAAESNEASKRSCRDDFFGRCGIRGGNFPTPHSLNSPLCRYIDCQRRLKERIVEDALGGRVLDHSRRTEIMLQSERRASLPPGVHIDDPAAFGQASKPRPNWPISLAVRAGGGEH